MDIQANNQPPGGNLGAGVYSVGDTLGWKMEVLTQALQTIGYAVGSEECSLAPPLLL